MNFIITLFASIFFSVFLQSSVYDIQINTLDGNTVSMQTYQNKKIIVTEFDAANPDINELQYLDSLQLQDTSIVLIAVPATDFSGTNTVENLKSIRDSINSHLIMTLPSGVKKLNGSNQNALFNWITNLNGNGHFDEDVDEADNIYMISRNGTLYSQLKKETPHQVIEASINQELEQ
jgi:glutathione peroxidase